MLLELDGASPRARACRRTHRGLGPRLPARAHERARRLARSPRPSTTATPARRHRARPDGVAPAPFTFRDGERVDPLRRRRARRRAASCCATRGFERLRAADHRAGARSSVPALAGRRAAVLHVPPGPVPEAAAAVRGEVGGRGRSSPSAAAAWSTPPRRSPARDGLERRGDPDHARRRRRSRRFHRMPAGVEGWRLVRPALVVARSRADGLAADARAGGDGDERAGARGRVALRAAAPTRWPSGAALRGARRCSRARWRRERARPRRPGPGRAARRLRGRRHRARRCTTRSARRSCALPDPARADQRRDAAALGAPDGHARSSGGRGSARRSRRVAPTGPLAPASPRRAPPVPPSAVHDAVAVSSVAAALSDPEAAAGATARIAAVCGHTRLGPLGVEEEHMEPIASAAARHPALQNTPDPPSDHEIAALVRAAL